MSEEGAGAATELCQLAEIMSRTPAEVLRDPDLTFNAAALRGYSEARRMAQQMAAAADPIGAAIAQASEED